MATSDGSELIMLRRSSVGGFVKSRLSTSTLKHSTSSTGFIILNSVPTTSPWILRPDGISMAIWSVCMVFFIIYQALSIPYLLAFDGNDSIFSLTMDFLCTLVFCMDIALSFNTSFYQKGVLVTDRRRISVNYLKGWFVLDVVSTFPYNWLIQSPFTSSGPNTAPVLIRILKIFRFMRTFRILRLVKMRQHLNSLRERLSNEVIFLFTFLAIILMMGFVAHMAACGFYYISQLSDSPQNWVTAVKLDNASDGEKYITALYWAVTTLTTTGFGDVVPVNSIERVYGIVLMVTAAGVFSFLVGKIATVISTMEKSASEHKESILALSQYLRNEEVPEDISYRALRYLDYVWDSRKKRKVLDRRILSGLSGPLIDQISDHIFGTIIGRVPFISQFEHGFVSQLAKHMEAEIYSITDCIFRENETSTDIYFLEKGKIEIFHEQTEHTYAILQPGQHFGEFAFITEDPRSASARCLQYVELLRLKRSSLVDLLALSPRAKYTFDLSFKSLKSGRFLELGITCYLCRAANHIAVNCHFAKVQIDKSNIQRKWLSNRKNASKRIDPQSNLEPNFQRKPRKVRYQKGYSVKNVVSEREFRKGKVTDSAQFRDRKPEKAWSEARIQTGTIHFGGTQGEDDFTPHLDARKRRFSLFRGVETYPLHSTLQGFMARGSVASPEQTDR